jgi:hypothetical protein
MPAVRLKVSPLFFIPTWAISTLLNCEQAAPAVQSLAKHCGSEWRAVEKLRESVLTDILVLYLGLSETATYFKSDRHWVRGYDQAGMVF